MTQYLNDHWTPDVTGLAYENMLDCFVDAILACGPPMAMAVYGGWGSGKTSFMRAAMARLGGELPKDDPEESLIKNLNPYNQQLIDSWAENFEQSEDVRTVWFNPWQHQNENQPMVALLQEIRAQFSLRLKMMNKTQKVAQIALKTGIRLMGDLIGSATKVYTGHAVKVDVNQIEKDGLAYEQERFSKMLDSQRFQFHFETAITHLLGEPKASSKRRLVIFVDDLDRCEKGQVLHLLEAVKLYLSTSKCVFVFGLDSEHTQQALEATGMQRHAARHYLNKLFQMTVPLPRSNQISSFIVKCFEDLNGDEVFANDSLDEPLADDLARILEANPRRCKNFLNYLFFRGRSYKMRVEACADPKVMAYLCALNYYYPQVYRFLEEEPSKLQFIRKSFQKPNLDHADDGLQRFIIANTHLPHYERKSLRDAFEEDERIEERKLPDFEGPHHEDHHARFVVLQRFKESFAEFPFDIPNLEEYLIP